MLKQIQNRLEEKGITLEIDEKAKEFITKKGTDSGYGATKNSFRKKKSKMWIKNPHFTNFIHKGM